MAACYPSKATNMTKWPHHTKISNASIEQFSEETEETEHKPQISLDLKPVYL